MLYYFSLNISNGAVKWNTSISFKNTYADINKTIHDDDFKNKHRFDKNSFTRNRKLPFPTLIRFFLNLNKGSNQQELDHYFSLISADTAVIQAITKSALTQARKQLKHTVFTDLNHQLINSYYAGNPHLKTWHGHRLCAIDGSQTRLPYEPEIIEAFGVNQGKENQRDCTLGLVSVYYDVLNNLCIDASINPTKTSERGCITDHLDVALENDLSLLDRGYNAFWVYSYYQSKKQAFCMRAKVGSNLLAKAFVESGKAEEVVTFRATPTAIEACREKGLSSEPITLRLIRVKLKNEVEVLITNLMDEVRYPANEFKGLYHLRWGIEENFKRLKQWVEIENFSGKSALSVKQDFHAKIVSTNLTFMLVNASQGVLNKAVKERKHQYQINYAQALSKMKNRLVKLLHLSHYPDKLYEQISELIKYIAQTSEAVRPGRSFKRPEHRIKNRKHYYAYARAL